ncbi:Cell division cycle-related protein res2/pct1 [Lasiodiplodia hormozganensis]|uniref:Cell division cycle-related protein res2/pct1 n=1 Tax=Lasiodiplodia hormozganensis TaxID=869390 RepID=A0AA39YVZ1_9PEZI|nr:Cell division cycle-related protein res2/pct1 [Lasiodiplodia hormozganensis]
MPPDNTGRIYSATYSNVPVYEFNVDSNHVMRRRADDWINATHILKVADFDKPARTRILEREVQKGVHEKVQGGYGKYQGTWIPLHDGRMLAERNGILDKLLPILDYVPGDRSPPPAPKHATAASSRPKAARQSVARRAPVAYPAPSQVSEDIYERESIQYADEETPDNVTIAESELEEHDLLHGVHYSQGGRKRKRDVDQPSAQDRAHQIWADALLDYFMLLESEDRFPAPPEPPPGVNLDRMIDEKGHSAMHWAAAMGDVDVVKDLIRRQARIDSLSNNLETPLMRAVMFTNNYDKNTMPQMIKILQPTVVRTDWFGSTVFHHIAATTSSKNKYACARYYLDCIINKLSETWIPEEVTRLLNAQDKNGDTAIMIAARHGARKCVRALLGRNVAVDIPNHQGETADDLIRELNARRRDGRHRGMSSSPFAPDGRLGLNGNTTFPGLRNGSNLQQVASPHQFRSQTAQTLMTKIAPTLNEKFEQLASAYEEELVEKDAEATDAERVMRKRQAEVDALKRQLRDMGIAEVDSVIGDTLEDPLWEEDARQQDEELEALTREAEALMELEQKVELQQRIADAEANGDAQQDGDDGSEASIRERLRLALSLDNAQKIRRGLVNEVVQNLSVAGMGERSTEYKRLITGALSIREEDVEGMLPEILSELEEAREREVLEASPE